MFNKKELLTTFSHREQMAVCEVLRENGIDYYVDSVGTASRNIVGRWPSVNQFGQTDNVEYRILVKRKQYQKAAGQIRNTSKKEDKATSTFAANNTDAEMGPNTKVLRYTKWQKTAKWGHLRKET